MSDQLIAPPSRESIAAGEPLTERLGTHKDRDPAIVEFRTRRRSGRISPVNAGIAGLGVLLVTFVVIAHATHRQRVVTTTQTAPRAHSLKEHIHKRIAPHRPIVCCRARQRRRPPRHRLRGDTGSPRHTTLTRTTALAEHVRSPPLRAPPATSAHSSPVASSSVPAEQNGFRYLGR